MCRGFSCIPRFSCWRKAKRAHRCVGIGEAAPDGMQCPTSSVTTRPTCWGMCRRRPALGLQENATKTHQGLFGPGRQISAKHVNFWYHYIIMYIYLWLYIVYSYLIRAVWHLIKTYIPMPLPLNLSKLCYLCCPSVSVPVPVTLK